MRNNLFRICSPAAWMPVLALLLLWKPAHAQGPFHDGAHHSWPEVLETTTVTGAVIVDASGPHPIHFLDEDGDGVADYRLAFGPWWYEPAGGAARPEAGSTVTVTAAVHAVGQPPSLIVFTVDGLTWRAPVEYGRHGWNGGGFWTEEGERFTVAGVALVDTTYFYHHYYLDSDGDALPDYQLGFGPAWYTPAGGAARPEHGQTVTVAGVLHDRAGVDRISVYELDGAAWRPWDAPAPWAGDWVRGNHAASTSVPCVNDTTSWISFSAGHMGHGMGGAWPDSTFVQFWQVPADSMPGPDHAGAFAGFYIDVHDPSGRSMMDGQFGGHGGMMQFEQAYRVRLHYHEDDLREHGLSEEGLTVRYWDDAMQRWMDVSGVQVDAGANAATFSSRELNNHYALVAPNTATAIGGTDAEVPGGMTLYQSYPNPFSEVATISYELSRRGPVNLTVYDALGRPVAVLVDGVRSAGRHAVTFEGGDLPDGVYLYRLESGERVRARLLTLLR